MESKRCLTAIIPVRHGISAELITGKKKQAGEDFLLYIYIYFFAYVCVCVYIYVHTHIFVCFLFKKQNKDIHLLTVSGFSENGRQQLGWNRGLWFFRRPRTRQSCSKGASTQQHASDSRIPAPQPELTR